MLEDIKQFVRIFILFIILLFLITLKQNNN